MASTPPDLDIFNMRMMWWSARNPPQDPQTSFAGKTILITGANVGLGFEAALKFATLGASRLIFGVRSLQRGEEAKAEICRRSVYDTNNIKLYQLDMSSFKTVQSFAEEILRNESRVDVAILNAGIAAPSYKLSPEGYETTLQINVLSTALLAVLLLPHLSKSARLTGQPTHLEFVGSSGQHGVEAETFNLLKDTKILEKASEQQFFDPKKSYCLSKLFVMYVMDNLVEANRHDSNVIITTVCPSLCRSNLGREFSLIAKVFNNLFQQVFARSSEEGSRTLVSGAALGKDANGEFWSHDVFYKKAQLVTSTEGKAFGKKVWGEMKEVLKPYVTQEAEYLIQ